MNLPLEFTVRLQKQLGDAYSELIDSFLQPPPTAIRFNPEKVKEFYGEKIPWTEFGFYLKERPLFTLDPLFHAGTYYVQEPSSMVVEQVFKQLLPPDEPIIVLDLCAAPGGKSTHIASMLNEKSLLIANEVINSRVKILTENIIKWGSSKVVVTNNDPKDFGKYNGLFDVILIDAPCSGEGLFRKDKEAVKEWSPENAHTCSLRQQRILKDVIPSLKPGGLLIYSTCTFNPEENEENVGWICKEYGLECLPLQLNDKWGVEEKRKAHCISYHFYPHKVKGEGLFLSVLRNTDNADEVEIKPLKQKLFSPLKKEFSFVEDWLKPDEEKKLFEENNKIKLLPARYIDVIESFYKNLRIVFAGVEIGGIKNKEVIPAHSLAMYAGIKKDSFSCIELTKEDALKFLRKEEFIISTDAPGWKLITHQQIPLGWIKHLGKRFNNYYPVEQRIRMNRTG